MPKLFIANCTKQHHDFVYRVPETMQLKSQLIKAGEQAWIAHSEFPSDWIQKIVSDHKRYGLVHASEVKNAKTFIGLCYTVDKPMTLDAILSGFAVNDEVLQDLAEERRERVAGEAVATIQNVMRPLGVNVPQAEVEFVEEPGDGKTPALAKGYQAVTPGRTPRHEGKQSSRR